MERDRQDSTTFYLTTNSHTNDCFFDKYIVKAPDTFLQIATFTFKLHSKVLIWRDSNYQNPSNTKTFQKIQTTFGNSLILYGVLDNEQAFQIIDRTAYKQTLFVISNRGNEGFEFLQACHAKRIPNKFLIYCHNDQDWIEQPLISLTTRPDFLFQYINNVVLEWPEGEYENYCPQIARRKTTIKNPQKKILIWREPKKNSESSSVRKVREKFGSKIEIHTVSDNQQAFDLIEQTPDKDLITVISNLGDNGLQFLFDCILKGISLDCLIFCRKPERWQSFPQIYLTTELHDVFDHLNDRVLHLPPKAYKSFPKQT